MIRSLKPIRALIAAIAIAALTLVVPAAPPVQAAGLVNCVDVTSPAGSRVGCYEDVWADGVQLRMTFAVQGFPGAKPADRVDRFYVIAPQTATPQGALPFPHDHTVRDVPQQSHGEYSVHLHAFFAICSAEGIASGACVPTTTEVQGLGTLPLATTVNGQALTSVEPIESAVSAGLITLIDTGAVLVATLGPSR
jgi:hypothetical protein